MGGFNPAIQSKLRLPNGQPAPTQASSVPPSNSAKAAMQSLVTGGIGGGPAVSNPKPPPPPPDATDAAVKAARSSQLNQLLTARGRRSTFLTLPVDPGPAAPSNALPPLSTGRKTFLGQ